MFVCFKGGKFLSHKQVFFDVLSPILNSINSPGSTMFVCFKGGKFLSHKQVFFDVLSPITPKLTLFQMG